MSNYNKSISYILGISGIVANSGGLMAAILEKSPIEGIIATACCLAFLLLFSTIFWKIEKLEPYYNLVVAFISTNVIFPIIFNLTHGLEGCFIYYFFISAVAYGASIKKKWFLIFPIASLLEYSYIIIAACVYINKTPTSTLIAFILTYLFIFIFIYFFSDISEKYYNALSDSVFKDELTGLYNRRKLNKDIEDKRFKYNIMIDIDNFHNVNNNFGHIFGDKILIDFASICLAHACDEFKVYRYGGEEFFILSRLSEEETISKLKKIQVDFKNATNITISIGLSEKLDFQTHQEIIKHADDNMLFIKKNGKDAIGFNMKKLNI